jgi:hypothetical protein
MPMASIMIDWEYKGGLYNRSSPAAREQFRSLFLAGFIISVWRRGLPIKFFHLIVILVFFLFLTGCSKKDPDFTGYVVNRTAKQITIVEITEKEPPNVLLHPGSKLEIGTKVEVRFKEKVIPTMFPTVAPAEVKVIKENANVNTMLEHLLSHINEKQGADSYTSVLSIQNQS